ncbi:MAG: hypothetical protein IMZ62_16055 [Chloroflexi bacterium]|nr:hypothetical protein [Chloroflexota bacterium]
MTKSKAIKLFCFDCAGESNKEVTLCAALDCQLWPFRFGNSPASAAYKSRMMTAKTNYAADFAEMDADGLEIARFFRFSSSKKRSVAQKSADAARGAALRQFTSKKGKNSETKEK